MVSLVLFLYIFLRSILDLPLTAATTCYSPGGNIETNTEYQPCSNDTSNPLSAVCCAWNRANGPDICVPNGLCQIGTKDGEPETPPGYTKPQCTHQNWDDPGCFPNVCNGKNLEFLTPCDKQNMNESRRWCCGLSDDCCNEDNHLQIETLAARFGDPTDIPSLSSTPTATSISASNSLSPSSSFPFPAPNPTSSAISSLNPNAQTQSASGLSPGAKAGIGVGATLGALVLIGLSLWLGRYLSARNAYAGRKKHPEMDASSSESYAYGMVSNGGGGSEAYKARAKSMGSVHEVEEQRRDVELPGYGAQGDPLELP